MVGEQVTKRRAVPPGYDAPTEAIVHRRLAGRRIHLVVGRDVARLRRAVRAQLPERACPCRLYERIGLLTRWGHELVKIRKIDNVQPYGSRRA